MNFAQIIILCLSTILSFVCGYKIFQIYQLSGYKHKPVYFWLKNTKFDYLVRYFAAAFLSFIGMYIYFVCFKNFEYYKYIGFSFFCFFSIVFAVVTGKEQKKTPLKITPRVLRALTVFFILCAGVNVALTFLFDYTPLDYSIIALSLIFVPFLVMLSFLIMSPFEKLNNNRYIKQAAKKLDENPGLIKIGITGSFGKTTAKNILAKFLEEKYITAVSPASFNTPIGLAKFINNGLKPQTEVLIAEMGAKFEGDIKELCDLVKPSYGLITSIGKQHLETFKTLENIVKTKFELIESLVPGGAAVFNYNCEEIGEMFEKAQGKKFLCGAKSDKEFDAYYQNVKTNKSGTSFELFINGLSVAIKTKLVGAHIPSLITSCAVLSSALGVSTGEIIDACSKLEPVAHRLQLIDNGEVVIIDDAYNSNLAGAKNALDVLKTIEGTKIIVTPGIVEMGREQSAMNIELGEYIGLCADIAFVTGPNAKDLKIGALKNMAEEKIVIVDKLSTAVDKITEISGKKAILFENDLPDNF